MDDLSPPVADVVDAPNKGGRPVRHVSEWGKPFLKGVRKSGNLSRSARKARVSPTTMRKYAKAHPEFMQRIAAALREYGDALEENLGILAFKGNVIANISRVKALNDRLARKYSEKAVDNRVLNLTINNQAAPPDVDATLERMLTRLSPDELGAMRGQIIDTTARMLPAGETPGETGETA